MGAMIAGGRYSLRTVHCRSPVLRVRYRDGITVDPHGFPDWIPYALAVVELPPMAPGVGVDEARVVDVLTANAAVARSGVPGWPSDGTPAGWTWAHLPTVAATARGVALVPIELHSAYRHLGGVSTGGGDRRRRGVPVDGGRAPRIRFTERLADDAVARLEEHLGVRLPADYRSFLVRTNGGRPASAAVHPDFGFVADQPLFGLARPDLLQDLAYANAWFDDRLTADWLAVGYVQGGLIAVRVRGDDRGSVWYLDDDDPRDLDAYRPAEVCERLLHRCADDFTAFWGALTEVPPPLHERAAAAPGAVVTPTGVGASLPAARRTLSE
jgi:hypothetical protein